MKKIKESIKLLLEPIKPSKKTKPKATTARYFIYESKINTK